MLKASDVTATKCFPSGSYHVSALVSGYLCQRTYFGYSKREAITRFLEEQNGTTTIRQRPA